MKKTLCALLALIMLLGTIPVMSLGSFADYAFTITPYESGEIMGFQNWAGPNGLQTQLLICTESFPQGLDHSIPWELTFTDMNGNSKTIVRCPDSGSGHWLYRFEICTGDDFFIPVSGREYAITARLEVNGKKYVAESDYLFWFNSDLDPIVPLENALESGKKDLVLSPLFAGWENWENSPNKGSESAVTQLLVGIKNKYNSWIMDIPADLDWKLTITEPEWSGGKVLKTIHCQPATKALQYNGLKPVLQKLTISLCL